MPIEDSKLLSSRQVAELTSLPKSTIRDMAARGEFPAPVEIPHSRRLGWREIQIREWLESLQHRAIRACANQR